MIKHAHTRGLGARVFVLQQEEPIEIAAGGFVIVSTGATETGSVEEAQVRAELLLAILQEAEGKR